MTTLSAPAACCQRQAAWPHVRIFDPDQGSLDRCQKLILAAGWQCSGESTWDSFCSALTQPPGCALLSCRNDVPRGIALAARCREAWPRASIILLASGLSVQAVVEAMRGGVDGVLELPLDAAALFDEIEKTTERAKARATALHERSSARTKIDKLGTSEFEVLRLVASGVPNKNIALRLDVAVRTVEKYRHSLFDNLGVNSAAEATRLFVLANLPSFV